CGVRNLAISEAAAPYGLFYAPDPSSQIACTIGGNVAENSGGVHCLKYGLTLHKRLKGRGFSARGAPPAVGGDAAGPPRARPRAPGGEGVRGVRGGAGVGLCPRPKRARGPPPGSDGGRRAGAGAAGVWGGAIFPAGLEMMDKPMTAAVEGFVHAGYDLDAAAI